MSAIDIEAAISAARTVAASEGAAGVAKHTNGQQGVWSARDEADLRAGYLSIWNPRRGYPERYRLRTYADIEAHMQARARLFGRVAETAAALAAKPTDSGGCPNCGSVSGQPRHPLCPSPRPVEVRRGR